MLTGSRVGVESQVVKMMTKGENGETEVSEGVGSNHFLVKFSITLKGTKKQAWAVRETLDHHLHYHQNSTFKREINFP